MTDSSAAERILRVDSARPGWLGSLQRDRPDIVVVAKRTQVPAQALLEEHRNVWNLGQTSPAIKSKKSLARRSRGHVGGPTVRGLNKVMSDRQAAPQCEVLVLVG